MTTPPYIGTVRIGNRVSLPIIDCQSWRVMGTEGHCVKGLDLSACGTCTQRESRNGNLIDPPIRQFGNRGAPTQTNATVEAVKPQVPEGGMRGLGDLVAKVTSSVGIKPCASCKERQALLNRAVPFKNPAP